MTAATLFLVGCGQRQHTEQVTLVRIDTVKTANTCDILEFPARVQAAGEVHLAFKIPGTLQRIYVDDGAFVRQGELVAEMDPRDYELQLQAVEAEYLSIKAEAERVMALYDQNVATADAYDKARYGLQQITAKYRGRDLKAGEKVPHEAVLTLTVGNGNETMPEDSALVNESGTANDDKPVVDESWF